MRSVDWATALNWIEHGAVLAVYTVAGGRRYRILDHDLKPVGYLSERALHSLRARAKLRVRSLGRRRILMEHDA